MANITRWMKMAAVAGTLGWAVSSASAVTLTAFSGAYSIDFDPTTVKFTNWIVGGVNQLGAGGIDFNGLPFALNNQTSLITGLSGPAFATYADNANSPTGTVSISFFGTELQFTSSTDISTGDITEVTDYNLSAQWQVSQVSNATTSGMNNTTVDPVVVGNQYTWNFGRQGSLLPVDITLTPNNAVPEPVTAIMGLAGLGLLGMRLTGRRGRQA